MRSPGRIGCLSVPYVASVIVLVEQFEVLVLIAGLAGDVIGQLKIR